VFERLLNVDRQRHQYRPVQEEEAEGQDGETQHAAVTCDRGETGKT